MATISFLIALASLYYLLSTLVSSIREFWNVRVGDNSRKLFLREMLEKMLTDEKSNLVAEIYRHPLIAQQLNGSKYMPSAIDSGNFADALFSVISEKSIDVNASHIERLNTSDIDKFKTGISFVSSFKQQQLLYSLLPPNAIDEALKTETTKTNIKTWYDNYMVRVSGEYKRRQRKPLFVIALIVAVSLNVNGITIFKELWQNQNAQKALEIVAQNVRKDTTIKSPIAMMDSITTKINDAGLPIGMNFSIWNDCFEKKDAFNKANVCVKPEPRDIRMNLFKLIAGYLIAAILMSMGAPFWWDFMNKFIDIRSMISPKK